MCGMGWVCMDGCVCGMGWCVCVGEVGVCGLGWRRCLWVGVCEMGLCGMGGVGWVCVCCMGVWEDVGMSVFFVFVREESLFVSLCEAFA